MTTNKFMEASDALYAGEADKAAELFTDGVAEVTRANTPTVDALANAVRQKLVADPAIADLFEKYPAIKEKKAYAMMVDEGVANLVARGEPLDVAIRKAGKAVADEYGLGKHGQASRRSASNPSVSDGDDDGSAEYPATIAAMLDSRAGRRGTD